MEFWSHSSGVIFRAARSKEVTGSELLVLLERRLDNVVYLMGFADSRGASTSTGPAWPYSCEWPACEYIPSFLIKQGDVVEPREKVGIST